MLIPVAGLGLLALAVVAVIVVTSGGGSSPTPAAGTTPAHATGTHRHASTPAPPHNQTTVAVLNGTTVAGLANTVANQLGAAGFVRGTVTNASSQDRTATVVSYLGGHDREAAEVAKALGLPSDAIGPIDPDTEASACPGGAGTCAADVVAIVGADRQ